MLTLWRRINEVLRQWSNKVNILSKNIIFIDDFYLKSNIIKTLYECQHYEDIKFHKIKYDLKGHKRQPLRYFFWHISSMYRFRWKFIWMLILFNWKLSLNEEWLHGSLLCYVVVSWLFTFWPLDLIAIFAYAFATKSACPEFLNYIATCLSNSWGLVRMLIGFYLLINNCNGIPYRKSLCPVVIFQ